MAARPSPEQKAAREQLAEARTRTKERKLRDRRLYRVGEVMETHGYGEPEDVEALMKTIAEALAYAELDHGADSASDGAVERAIEESEPRFAEERRMGREFLPLALQPPFRREAPASTARDGTLLVAACTLALLGPSVWELSRCWRGGGAGWAHRHRAALAPPWASLARPHPDSPPHLSQRGVAYAW